MRPIGSWLFGRIADKHGRKKSMVISICLMAFSSFLFAALPTYEQVGMAAPFLLLLVRAALPLTLPAGVTAAVSYALLAALGWPLYVRSVTTRVEAMRRSGWFLHARASGMGLSRVLRVHVVPHLWPISLTQFLLCVPLFLIAEANLGSLGLGVGEPLDFGIGHGYCFAVLAGRWARTGERWVMVSEYYIFTRLQTR